MKEKFLIILLFSIKIYSQQEFYVDDAKTIDYVTINFCVDSIGRTSSVKLIPEKTSYKNLNIINSIIENQKTINYTRESLLKNQCFDYTYRFINTKYKSKSLSEADCKKCIKFQEGKFKYLDIVFPDVIIDRSKNIQIEINGDEVSKYNIQWISPCKYVLIFTEVADKRFDYLIGEKIDIEIIDILDNDTYLYKSNLLERTIITGLIRRTQSNK